MIFLQIKNGKPSRRYVVDGFFLGIKFPSDGRKFFICSSKLAALAMNCFLKKVITVLVLSGIAACTSSRPSSVGKTENVAVRYRKVYEGNKIIIKPKTLQAAEKKSAAVHPAAENQTASTAQTYFNFSENRPLPTISKTVEGTENRYQKVRLGGSFRHLSALKKESKTAEKPKGDGRVAAVLGFALGLFSVVTLFAGGGLLVLLIFGLAGFIFSLNGLSSPRLALAILGLVFSVFTLLLLVIALT